jgi:hypothetical protein
VYFGYGYRDAESFDLEKYSAVTATYLTRRATLANQNESIASQLRSN